MEIDADPSKADQLVLEFAQRTGESIGLVEAQMREYNRSMNAAYDEAVQRARGLGDELGAGVRAGADEASEGILSARQSTMLLGQEFGLHLPRAVSSAVAEMLPEIAGLGTGLLAVFAVEEVVKFAAKIHKLADEFNGVADAAQELKLAEKEDVSAMEEMAKKSEKYAQDQLKLLNVQILAQEAHVSALRDENEGLGQMNPIITQITQAFHFWTGESKDLKQATAGLRAEEELRDKIVKILGEDEAAAKKKAEKGVRDYSDALAAQLQSARENVEALTSQELPARQRIELEIQRQIDAATREIAKDQELFAHKKIGHATLVTEEREYTDLVSLLSLERASRIIQEAAKEGAAEQKRWNEAEARLREHLQREQEAQAKFDLDAQTRVQGFLGKMDDAEARSSGQRIKYEADKAVKTIQSEEQTAVFFAHAEAQKFALMAVELQLQGKLTEAQNAYNQAMKAEAQEAQIAFAAEKAIAGARAKEQIDLQQNTTALQKEAQSLRDLRMEMDSGTIPAVRRIEHEYDVRMTKANQEIQLERQKYQQGRIYDAEMAADEQAYTEIVVNSAALRTGAMKAEALQQASTLATMLGLQQEFVIAEAVYMIPKDLALGFAALGAQDYWSATQYFLAAAQWGVAAGKAVQTIAGGGSSKGTQATSQAGTSSASSAIGSSAASQQPTTNSVIRVELPASGQIPVSYVRDLINQINTQVQYNNVTLHATYSRSASPRA
jgi:hypothetical protein